VLFKAAAVITIANMARSMLLVCIAIMAATGEASAQSSPVIVKGTDGRPLGNFAVIAKSSVPYYIIGGGGNLNDVGTTPPQGQFAAGQHICVIWEVTLRGRELIKVDLPSEDRIDQPDGDKAIAVYSRETFTPDPADKECVSIKRQLNSMNGTVIIPNTVTDPALRANIADMAVFLHSNLLVTDPGAKNIMTKDAIAEGFYSRGNGDWIYDDKQFDDLTTACRWYQMVLDQIKIEYPNIRNNALRFQSDPSGSIANMVNKTEDKIRSCPTAVQRQQARAVAEQKKKDEAVRQEEAANEAANEAAQSAAELKLRVKLQAAQSAAELKLRCDDVLFFIYTSANTVHVGQDPDSGWWANKTFHDQEPTREGRVGWPPEYTGCLNHITQYVRISPNKIEFGQSSTNTNVCGVDRREDANGHPYQWPWRPGENQTEIIYRIDRLTGLLETTGYSKKVQCEKLNGNAF
jgi:hypothetical protein